MSHPRALVLLLIAIVGTYTWAHSEDSFFNPAKEIPQEQPTAPDDPSGETFLSVAVSEPDCILTCPGPPPATPLQATQIHRHQLIQSLQMLQDAYCRNAQLDEALAVREMIRELQSQSERANLLPPPNDAVYAVPPLPSEPVTSDDLRSLRGQHAAVVYRRVTGQITGSVWGGENRVYTDDSTLSTAAVHAGVVAPGETAIVRITILPGQDSYAGETRHGVTSRPWDSFGGSYRIDGSGRELSRVDALQGQDLPPFSVYTTGNLTGSVYGTGTYTDDSDIGTAAVHAGLLKTGESGFVMVTLEGGKAAYEASTRHGVTTYSYGQWSGSYRLSAYEAPTLSQ